MCARTHHTLYENAMPFLQYVYLSKWMKRRNKKKSFAIRNEKKLWCKTIWKWRWWQRWQQQHRRRQRLCCVRTHTCHSLTLTTKKTWYDDTHLQPRAINENVFESDKQVTALNCIALHVWCAQVDWLFLHSHFASNQPTKPQPKAINQSNQTLLNYHCCVYAAVELCNGDGDGVDDGNKIIRIVSFNI